MLMTWATMTWLATAQRIQGSKRDCGIDYWEYELIYDLNTNENRHDTY